MAKEFKYFSSAAVIPKGTYSGIDEDVVTTGTVSRTIQQHPAGCFRPGAASRQDET